MPMEIVIGKGPGKGMDEVEQKEESLIHDKIKEAISLINSNKPEKAVETLESCLSGYDEGQKEEQAEQQEMAPGQSLKDRLGKLYDEKMAAGK